MHKALIVFHRWLALVTSVFILVLALTGSALVFEGAIDRGLNPQLWRVTPGTQPLSFDTLTTRALAALSKGPITAITPSAIADRAYSFQAAGTNVFVDPYTGRVLGTREGQDFNRTLPRRLHVLHVSLLADEIGKEVVGIVTIAALLLVITGAIIWWRDKLWRIRWSASWKRIVFDIHHSLGIIASLVLFAITLSGMVIHYEPLGDAILKLDAAPRTPTPKQPPASNGATRIAIDSAARAAVAALPGANIMNISALAKSDQPLAFAMRFPEDRTPGGRSRVYVDRYRGTVLLVVSTRGAPIGRSLSYVMRSVHTGDVLGKPTEAVWLVAALVLAGQAITGVMMWWNGRAGRAAIARRRR
ncbi:MAG: PepSY-associated TM helix domain-containing protein [bacterium]